MGFVLFSTALLTVIFLTFKHTFLNGSLEVMDNSYGGKDCNGDEINALACQIKANMNENINPCDDFYEFACGNYQKINPIPKSKTGVTELNKIKDFVERQLLFALESANFPENPQFILAKKYFKMCVDEENIEKMGLRRIKEILKKMGDWPVLSNNNSHPSEYWNKISFDINNFGIDPDYLMTYNVDTDYVNTSVRILSLLPPSFTLGRETLLLGQNDPNVAFYYNYMVNMSRLFGADEETAKRDMEEALNFEISLAKTISKSITEYLANISASYNVYTIEFLNDQFPDFPWFEYLTRLTPKGTAINNNTKIIVTDPEYVTGLIQLLQKTPRRVVANYLIWRFISDAAKYLNKDVVQLEFQFLSNVLGMSEMVPRKNKCIDLINKKLGQILSSMYVRLFFTRAENKDIATGLTKTIKQQFREIMSESPWPKDDIWRALDKLDNIEEHIAYPVELFNDTELNSAFKDLQISEDDFLASSLNINKFLKKVNFGRLYEPVNKSNWFENSLSTTVNAFYKPDSNSIILPAAILQGTYFNPKRPKFSNYGSIGFVIAHELTHGFDDVGQQFDKNGDLDDSWSEEVKQDHQMKKSCLIKQFNRFKVQNLSVDGALTVTENMADYGGVKVAYLAYLNWTNTNGPEEGLPGLKYNPKQLYWLSVANTWCSNINSETERLNIVTDRHAPNKYRVNGPLMNLKMFADDFMCPSGSNMNPAEKCEPW